jgi:hypothetical protein
MVARLTLAKSAAAALALMLSTTAFACRCLEPSSPRAAYGGADAVVVGTVVSVRQNAEKTAIATVRVSQRWKRDVADEIELPTVATTCAFEFVQGKEYLFFMRELPNKGGYSTARCRGNVTIDEASQQLAWLARHGKVRPATTKP